MKDPPTAARAAMPASPRPAVALRTKPTPSSPISIRTVVDEELPIRTNASWATACFTTLWIASCRSDRARPRWRRKAGQIGTDVEPDHQAASTLNGSEVLPKRRHEALLGEAARPELEDEAAHLGEGLARERA